MNLQEQYDFVVEKLRKQGVKSLEQSVESYINPYDASVSIPLCFYRGHNGLKCAAGWLIPDEVYTGNMEMKSWDYVVEKFQDVLPNHLKTYESKEMVLKLQHAHDSYLGENNKRFEEVLEDIASEFNLVYTAPKIQEQLQ
ncbi:hypothetical protein [Synechococcus phage BUCT-ZZ01]|nr:hypothetical protein [Synechococcus phage BUCT-ZZ01]